MNQFDENPGFVIGLNETVNFGSKLIKKLYLP